jgi:hypothetical protein
MSFPDVQLHIVDAPFGADPESRSDGIEIPGSPLSGAPE